MAATSSASALHAESGPSVSCPQCRTQTYYTPHNPYRPFCSARCKGHDLGAWASEQFRVAAIEPPDDGLHTPD